MVRNKFDVAVSNFIKTDWQYPLPGTGYEIVSVISANGYVYVASNGYVFQLEPVFGTLINQNSLPNMKEHEVRMVISKGNDKLIIGTYGNVIALDANDISKELWANSLQGEDTGVVALVAGTDKVYAATGGYINTLLLSDGSTSEKNALSGMGTAEVRLALSADEKTLAAGISGNVICLDATNITNLLWTNNLKGQGEEVVNVLIQKDVVYAGTNGFVNSIDLSKGGILQTNSLPKMGNYEVRLCLSADGTTIYGGINGNIAAMDVQNLESSKWVTSLPEAKGNVVNIVTSGDGFIYAGAAGRVSQLDPIQGEILNTNNLPGQGVNEVRLSMGQDQSNLYIGTNGYAIGTSELGAASISRNNWMESLGEIIENMQIKAMLIPGTHDSGSYGINATSLFSPEDDLQFYIKLIRNIISPSVYLTVGEVVALWAKAQGYTAYAQLMGGIRYLDLRLSNRDGEIWISHSLYSVPVINVLNDVKNFIANNPKEIIILDFNHLYGFDYSLNEKMIVLLTESFGSKMANSSLGSSVTINQLWEADQQLLVFYKDDSTCDKYSFLWKENNLDSPSYSPTTSDKLLEDLTESAKGLTGATFSYIHGQLTPDDNMIKEGLIPFNGKPSSLMSSAEENNPIFMNWVKQQPYDSKLNIIASDWVFTMDDFISQCILVNQKRANS